MIFLNTLLPNCPVVGGGEAADPQKGRAPREPDVARVKRLVIPWSLPRCQYQAHKKAAKTFENIENTIY